MTGFWSLRSGFDRALGEADDARIIVVAPLPQMRRTRDGDGPVGNVVLHGGVHADECARADAAAVPDARVQPHPDLVADDDAAADDDAGAQADAAADARVVAHADHHAELGVI